jgi:hypothetical protein
MYDKFGLWVLGIGNLGWFLKGGFLGRWVCSIVLATIFHAHAHVFNWFGWFSGER